MNLQQLGGQKLYRRRNAFILSDGVTIYQIDEPIGWDKVEIIISMDDDINGFKFEFTDGEIKLEFDEIAGKSIIENAYNNDGTDAEITLAFGEILDDNTFKVLFDARLNFNEYEINKYVVKLNAEKRSFGDLFRSRFDTQTDILSTTTIGGQVVPELQTDDVFLHPRQTFKNSDFIYNTNVDTFFATPPIFEDAAIVSIRGFTPAFKKRKDEIPELREPTPPEGVILYTGTQYPSGVATKKFVIRVKAKFSYQKDNSNQSILNGVFLAVIENFSDNPTSGDSQRDVNDNGNVAGTFSYDGDVFYSFDLPPDTVVKIRFGGLSSQPFNAFNYTIDEPCQWIMEVQDKTLFSSSVVKMPRLFDAIQRNLELITDEREVLVSDFLSDGGCGYGNHLASGKMLRLAQSATLNFSAKKWFDSLNTIFCLGMSIERDDNGDEHFRLEERGYFNPDVELGELSIISNYSKKADTKNIFNELEFGYKKYPDDGETSSIDEWNTKHEYVTPIETNKSRLKKISDFLLSSYFIEYARQRAFFENNQNDENCTQAQLNNDTGGESYETDDDTFMIATLDGQQSFDLDLDFQSDNQLIISKWDLPIVVNEEITISGTTLNNGVYVVNQIEIDIISNTATLSLNQTVNNEVVNAQLSTTTSRPQAEKDEPFQNVTGILNPQSAYNLRHHIKRIIIRWAKIWLSSLFYKNDFDSVKFVFGPANNNLSTTLDSNEQCIFDDFEGLSVRDDATLNKFVLNQIKPIYKPNKIEFEAPLSWDAIDYIRNAFEGRSPDANNYGYFKFKNPKGEEEKGRLMKIKFKPTTEIAKFILKENG